jgi:hypothetical protein
VRKVKRYLNGGHALKLSATDALMSTDRAGIRAAIIIDVPLKDQPAAEKHTSIVFSKFKLHYRGNASSFDPPPRNMAANNRAATQLLNTQRAYSCDMYICSCVLIHQGSGKGPRRKETAEEEAGGTVGTRNRRIAA